MAQTIEKSMEALKLLAPEAGFKPPTPAQEATLLDEDVYGSMDLSDKLPPGVISTVLLGLNNLIKNEMNATESAYTKHHVAQYMTPIQTPGEFEGNVHSIGVTIDAVESAAVAKKSGPRPLPSPNEFRQMQVFGAKFAMEVNAAISRASEGSHQEQRVVQFGIAPKIASNPEGKIDWGSIINLQVTDRDMPLVAAVLEGHMDELVLNFYGSKRNKSLELKRLPNGLHLTIKTAALSRSILVGPSDLFRLTMLVMAQLRYNYKAVSDVTISKTLAAVAAMYEVNSQGTGK